MVIVLQICSGNGKYSIRHFSIKQSPFQSEGYTIPIIFFFFYVDEELKTVCSLRKYLEND